MYRRKNSNCAIAIYANTYLLVICLAKKQKQKQKQKQNQNQKQKQNKNNTKQKNTKDISQIICSLWKHILYVPYEKDTSKDPTQQKIRGQ